MQLVGYCIYIAIGRPAAVAGQCEQNDADGGCLSGGNELPASYKLQAIGCIYCV